MNEYRPPGPHTPMPPVTDEDYVQWIAGHDTGEMLKRHHQPAEGSHLCAACEKRWPCAWHDRAVRAIQRRRRGAG
jgi:hypothetical protein